jgi:hypothetical protein
MTAVAMLTVAATIGGLSSPAAPGEPPGPQRDKGYEAEYPYCNTYSCDQRAKRRGVQKRHKAQVRWRAHMQKVVRPFNARLNRMAGCESGGRWHIATGNGFYGGLQFKISSWRSVGGPGMPHWATPLHQKYRAVLLMRVQGWGAWPVCQYA